MTSTVTDIASKFRPENFDPATTLAQLRRADKEINRVGRNPNDILPRLLEAGCEVTFTAHSCGAGVVLKMPDASLVHGYGVTPSHAMVDAYSEGGWLADLPAALVIAAEG